MLSAKRVRTRRSSSRPPMSVTKQTQYLNQHQTQLVRKVQQQTRYRRAHIVRSVTFLVTLAVTAGYAYHLFGAFVAITVVLLGWLVGWLEVVQIFFAWVVRNAGQPNFDELLRRADIMSEPMRAKNSVTGENEFLEYGASSMQGWRRSMEDAHTLLLLDKGGFFGVYDGHSGAATAKYCGEYMFQFVHQTKAFMKGEISKALYDGFIAIDKYLHSLPSFERGGCAAVVLYVDGDDVYCANAGDSRCVMCRNGSVDALSTDHKPFLPSEQMRIERAGCYVLNRRVNGMLALSRAIGDFMFKNNTQISWEMQAVTSAPEVRVTKLNRDKDEFAVLACDGIWDIMSSKQVVDFVRPRMQQRMSLGRICEELMDACLSPQPFRLGCDNMSVVIVKFKRAPQGGVQNSQTTANDHPNLPVTSPVTEDEASVDENCNASRTNGDSTALQTAGDDTVPRMAGDGASPQADGDGTASRTDKDGFKSSVSATLSNAIPAMDNIVEESESSLLNKTPAIIPTSSCDDMSSASHTLSEEHFHISDNHECDGAVDGSISLENNVSDSEF